MRSMHFILEPPSEAIQAQFKSTPWAWKLFNDPTLHAMVNESRVIKATNNADTFVSKTLATYDTIRAWQSFYKNVNSPEKSEEVWSLLSLGSGVNGHVDTSHGGFISLVHDESLGLAAESSRPEDKTTMTAYLKIDYKKPMTTPNVVLCRAWLEKKEGKKLFVRGLIEDGQGNVLSISEAMFIIVERAKLRANI
jgi:thioesterase superfamily protein 4